MSSSNPTIPEDIQTREGMQLFILLNEVKNLVNNLNAKVENFKKNSVDPDEFDKLKREVERVASIVDTVSNTGKTIVFKLFNKLFYALVVAALGSDLLMRLFHHAS